MPVSDLTGTTWVLNDDISGTGGFNAYVNFTSNNTNYDYFDAVLLIDDDVLWYMNNALDTGDEVYSGYEGGWQNEAYKTITITGGTDATNATLIAWLEANGTLTVPKPKYIKVNNTSLRAINGKFISNINGVSVQCINNNFSLKDKIFAYDDYNLYYTDKNDLDHFVLLKHFTRSIYGVAYGNGKLAVIFNIAQSYNNINYLEEGNGEWKEASTNFDYPMKIFFKKGENVFVASKTGSSAAQAKSSDLINWTTFSSSSLRTIGGFNVVEDYCFRASDTAASQNYSLFGYDYSSDGLTWSQFRDTYHMSVAGNYIANNSWKYLPIYNSIYEDGSVVENNTVVSLKISVNTSTGANTFVKSILDLSDPSNPKSGGSASSSPISGTTKFTSSRYDLKVTPKNNRAVLPLYTFSSSSPSSSTVPITAYLGEQYIDLSGSTITYSKLFDPIVPSWAQYYYHETEILWSNDDYSIIYCRWGGGSPYQLLIDFYLWKHSNNQVTLMNTLPPKSSTTTALPYKIFDPNK